MSAVVIFIAGSVVFSLTVYGAVMGAGIALTRRFYEENDGYTDRPGFEEAGAGRPAGSSAEDRGSGDPDPSSEATVP